MAVGRATGENRASEAAQRAISNALLDVTIDGARGVLFNVRGGADLTLYEVTEAAEIVKKMTHPDANIIFGAVIDEEMGDDIQITVIATGFDQSGRAQEKPRTPGATTGAKTIDFPVRSFDSDDLDIPAFLRRQG